MTHRPAVDPVALLVELLYDGDQRFVARAFGRAESAVIAMLVAAGLIVQDGTAESTICDACDEAHLVEVITGGPDAAYGWHCPAAGFVEAQPDELAALTVTAAHVARTAGESFDAAFGPRRWRFRPLGDGTDAFLLGVWPIGGIWTTVVLVRDLVCTAVTDRTAAALRKLSRNDAGLILTVGEGTALDVPRFATVPLPAALTLDSEGRLAVVVDLLKRELASQATERLVLYSGRPGVEGKVFAVIDGLFARDLVTDEDELNAAVVERAWPDFRPGEASPKPSTLRKHIATWKSREP